jgi:hypothetical protein
MRLARYFLILCSAVGLIAVYAALKVDRYQAANARDAWVVMLVGFLLFGNLLFLISLGRMPETPRIFKVVSLWLDAKIAELTSRSTRPSD